MDITSPNSKNVLMELESLKSKECISKMKESNYIKDKEILEDSIKTLQKDLQEKAEIIRILRKDLDSQSSNLYQDIAMKNEELEKCLCENNDLSKKLTIALETIDHHVKRNETIKSEFEKLKKNNDREIECKSRLVGFLEASNSQKDVKIAVLASELDSIKYGLSNAETEFETQKQINEELQRNIEEMKRMFDEQRQEKEMELQRAKTEILQLQQNGISELHLEKMNPTAAATIKALKSSKGLMDIYSELHAVIGERDILQLGNKRLLREKEQFTTSLLEKTTEIEKLTKESNECKKITDGLKSRLLGLVSELRASESKRAKVEREMLLVKRNLENSEREVVRLMEQVRVFLVTGDIDEDIKREPVDVDRAMYTSVQELQEVNRALRNDNDLLRNRLEASDSEQFKQKCIDLKATVDRLESELGQLRHGKAACKHLSTILEKEVKMLLFLIEMKCPGSAISIQKALKNLETGVKNSVEIVRECEIIEDQLNIQSVPDNIEDTERITKLENEVAEILENKKASDEVYQTTIDSIRSELSQQAKQCFELRGKLEEVHRQHKEEREINERYRKECDLLRAINKNLSQNASTLEAQADDFRVKLECKISQLAEKKAELDGCKTQLLSARSSQQRLIQERDELKKNHDMQQQVFTNIKSLQNAANLKDHLCLSNLKYKVEELEKTVTDLQESLEKKNEELSALQVLLDESKALEESYNASMSPTERSDAECQVTLLNASESTIDVIPINHTEIMEYKNMIHTLEQQIVEMKESHICTIDQLNALQDDMVELNKKCDFYENQLSILEKAKQEVLTENIKLTEEAHNLNASLKQDLQKHLEELSRMRVRLDEAETVERTAQSVIDKYVKECNEAKAKYKRELTLHAADSKLIESLNKEINEVRSRETEGEDKCQRLREELAFCEQRREQQIDDMQAQIQEVEAQLREAESKNDRLYNQLSLDSEDDSVVVLNEIIEDLRRQISIDRLSNNLSTVEREKFTIEADRLRSEVASLESQLALERGRVSVPEGRRSLDTGSVEAAVVRESNQVLREQKAVLDRVVLGQRTEMEGLAREVAALRAEADEARVRAGTLAQQRTEVEEERTRWKERCTKLIERAEQLDPEKYRVACNDRDRFEKQSLERENSLREVNTELHKTKEEVKELSVSVEDERNKLKREEQIGLQLKEIARKYKSESEKRRQSIVALEESVSELKEEISELQKEGDELKEQNKVLISDKGKLESRVSQLIIELEGANSRLGLELSDAEARTTVLTREKQDLKESLELVESELDSLTKVYDELNCRCELLEQMEREKSMKLQLTESTIGRLQMENKNLKRVFETQEEKEDEMEQPQSKRVKSNDDIQSEAPVEETKFEGTKIWWNVATSEDVPETEEGEYDESDAEMEAEAMQKETTDKEIDNDVVEMIPYGQEVVIDPRGEEEEAQVEEEVLNNDEANNDLIVESVNEQILHDHVEIHEEIAAMENELGEVEGGQYYDRGEDLGGDLIYAASDYYDCGQPDGDVDGEGNSDMGEDEGEGSSDGNRQDNEQEGYQEGRVEEASNQGDECQDGDNLGHEEGDNQCNEEEGDNQCNEEEGDNQCNEEEGDRREGSVTNEGYELLIQDKIDDEFASSYGGEVEIESSEDGNDDDGEEEEGEEGDCGYDQYPSSPGRNDEREAKDEMHEEDDDGDDESDDSVVIIEDDSTADEEVATGAGDGATIDLNTSVEEEVEVAEVRSPEGAGETLSGVYDPYSAGRRGRLRKLRRRGGL